MPKLIVFKTPFPSTHKSMKRKNGTASVHITLLSVLAVVSSDQCRTRSDKRRLPLAWVEQHPLVPPLARWQLVVESTRRRSLPSKLYWSAVTAVMSTVLSNDANDLCALAASHFAGESMYRVHWVLRIRTLRVGLKHVLKSNGRTLEDGFTFSGLPTQGTPIGECEEREVLILPARTAVFHDRNT
jgi:hypothetical protein